MKNSYYCSARNGGTIRGSEQQVINRCNSDPRCTGYDYRKVGNYGHLCRQTSYPGSSRKCCGYKLCGKNGKCNNVSSVMNPEEERAQPSLS